MAFHSSLISAPFIPLYLIYLLNLSCTDCQSSSHLNCNHQRLLIFLLIDKNDHTNVAMLKRAHFSRSISKCSKAWYLTWTRIRLKIVPNMLTQGAHHLCLKKKKILTCGISCSIFCKIVRPLRNKKIEGILGNNFHHLLATLKLRGDSVGYNCVKHGCALKKWSLYFLNIIARVITVMCALWLVEDYFNHLAQCDYSRS